MCLAPRNQNKTEAILYQILYVAVQSPRRIQLFMTLWTVAHQAPLSVGFFRQEYWSGLPFPPPRDLPDPGIESASLVFPELIGRLFTTVPPKQCLSERC